jgi:carotenoid cleavage dioxygenase-like enzyme
VRNSPALFEVAQENFSNWFDGLSALHKTTFANRPEIHTCKFLLSETCKIFPASRTSSATTGSAINRDFLNDLRKINHQSN